MYAPPGPRSTSAPRPVEFDLDDLVDAIEACATSTQACTSCADSSLAEDDVATMVDCILALYRSAVDVAREWARDFDSVPAPGLVLLPSDDPFLSASGARAGADRAGAKRTAADSHASERGNEDMSLAPPGPGLPAGNDYRVTSAIAWR